MSLSIRPARPGEAALVLAFVRELAEYERLLDAVDATEAMVDAALFGENPRLFCDIAEWDAAPAGFALWFANFSLFQSSTDHSKRVQPSATQRCARWTSSARPMPS